MKLKTLKDCYMSDSRNYEQAIREEAIKHYKSLINVNDIENPEEVIANGGAIRWIVKFFNITEEELSKV